MLLLSSGWGSLQSCLNEKHLAGFLVMPCLVLHFLLFIVCCSSAHLVVALHKAVASKLCTCLLLKKKTLKASVRAEEFPSLAVFRGLG